MPVDMTTASPMPSGVGVSRNVASDVLTVYALDESPMPSGVGVSRNLERREELCSALPSPMPSGVGVSRNRPWALFLAGNAARRRCRRASA